MLDQKQETFGRTTSMVKQLISGKFGRSINNDRKLRGNHNIVYKLVTSDSGSTLNTTELGAP